MRRPERYCPYGASHIARLLSKLAFHMESAVTMDDPEDVHQLRVTSRRIRAALPIFKECFEGRKRWKPQIKELTRSLGAARDLDVQIMFLRGLKKECGRRRMGDGIAILLKLKERQRSAIQPEVVASLERIKGAGTLEEMAAECSSYPTPSTSISLYFLANRHFSAQYEELVSLSDGLEDEASATRQHEMRIAAKKLRYTVEIFADLYEDKMSSELSYLKRLQDVLGDIHDCDVWLRELPAAQKKAAKAKAVLAGRGLSLFQAYLMERRHKLYSEAVVLWKKKRESMPTLDRAVGVDAVLPCSGRIAIISDIHGNHHALSAVVRDAQERGATLFLNAGDSVGFGALPEQVVEEISGDVFISIVGNFDRDVLKDNISDDGSPAEEEKNRSIAQTKRALSQGSKRFLGSLMGSIRLCIGDRTVSIDHASPLSKKEHVTKDTPEDRLREIAQGADADLVIVGHSHLQFMRRVGDRIILNPGSVGRPGDGDPRAAYAMMNPVGWTFELIRVPYDVEGAAEAIRKEKLPEHFAKMLIRGRSLESVIEEEATFPQDMRSQEAEAEAIGLVRALGDTIDPDPAHTEAVRAFALTLFDELRVVHNMGNEERFLLECASLLHDIGWSRPGGGHHISSMELVLNDQSLPLNTRERYMVASIARYHNSLPKAEHYNYSVLTAVDRRTVLMAASILRIADAMDASHQGAVELRSIESLDDRIVLRGIYKLPSGEEVSKFAAKKDLFERTFRKGIDLELQRIVDRSRASSRSRPRPS